MRYLITGGLGFIGCNLAGALMDEGEEVAILDNTFRLGSEQNRHWLETKGGLAFFHGDIRNRGDVEHVFEAFSPDRVFHLAGQVAMTRSVENPRLDFEVNALGTLNVLECMRHFAPDSHLIFASTNKVYGDLSKAVAKEARSRYVLPDYPMGIAEDAPLDFHSPYGCSKGAADQYVLDYHRIFGLRTTVFRHSTVYGARQFTTFDQGWIGWFCMQAILQKKGLLETPFTISGDGKQVRDALFSSDCVQCYLMASRAADRVSGRAYNIGGGADNSLSILELLKMLEKELNHPLEFTHVPWRSSDQRVFISDIRRARNDFGWTPITSVSDGVSLMLRWTEEIIEARQG